MKIEFKTIENKPKTNPLRSLIKFSELKEGDVFIVGDWTNDFSLPDRVCVAIFNFERWGTHQNMHIHINLSGNDFGGNYIYGWTIRDNKPYDPEVTILKDVEVNLSFGGNK